MYNRIREAIVAPVEQISHIEKEEWILFWCLSKTYGGGRRNHKVPNIPPEMQTLDTSPTWGIFSIVGEEVYALWSVVCVKTDHQKCSDFIETLLQ